MLPPRHHARLLLLTFLECAAAIFLERGIYFFTDERLHFTPTQNLWLAMLFGICYALGAWLSHPIAHRLGEKRMLRGLLVILIGLHAWIGFMPHGIGLVVAFAGIGLMIGAKWPIIESYVNAGRSTHDTIKSVGRFNLAWASSVPLTLAAVGPLLDGPYPASMFWIALSLHVTGLGLTWPLPQVPAHLPDDHPHRPDGPTSRYYHALLRSSRWALLGSCAMMFLVAPLMPTIFDRLHVAVDWAPAASSLLDWVRLMAFFILGWWTAWHGRRLPLVGAGVALPIGFALILFGPNLLIVLLGEIIFGLAMGMCYYAALYYAMVVKNASVDAGGAHEAIIGSGVAIGPMLGLLGFGLAPAVGSSAGAMLISIGPLVLLCLGMGLWPLMRTAR